MEHLTTHDLRQLLTLVHELSAIRDKQSLIRHVISSLSSLIQSDVTSYNDINATAGTACYEIWPTDFTLRPNSAELIGRFAEQIPVLSYWARTKNSPVKRYTDLVPMNEFRRTDIFNEFYAPNRIPYTIAVPLAFSQSTTITIAQHRDRKDFSDRDRSFLEAFHPHLLQAYANVQALAHMNQEMAARDCALDHLNRGMVSVMATGTIRWTTKKGRQLLQEFFHPCPCIDGRLPETIMEWMRMKNPLTRDPTRALMPHPPLTIQHGERRLRICSVSEDTGGLLLLEECCERFPREECLALGLTPREVEVLSWLVQGKTNAEIGVILHISPRTIQKHVERIFVKLGVENRIAAVALVHALRQTTPGW